MIKFLTLLFLTCLASLAIGQTTITKTALKDKPTIATSTVWRVIVGTDTFYYKKYVGVTAAVDDDKVLQTRDGLVFKLAPVVGGTITPPVTPAPDTLTAAQKLVIKTMITDELTKNEVRVRALSVEEDKKNEPRVREISVEELKKYEPRTRAIAVEEIQKTLIYFNTNDFTGTGLSITSPISIKRN